MTKKHFIALADAIKRARIVNNHSIDYSPLRSNAESVRIFYDGVNTAEDNMLAALANFCASQSPRFNRQLWLDYIEGKCGPSGGKRK